MECRELIYVNLQFSSNIPNAALQPSPELDKVKIEDKMREMTNSDEVHVGIRFQPQYLDAILNSGRFKSQFETGSSGGLLDKGGILKKCQTKIALYTECYLQVKYSLRHC